MIFEADLNAKTYNKYSFLQKSYSRVILNKVNFSGNESVLDVGCGDGVITSSLLKFVPNGKVIGIDPSQQMIELAKKINQNASSLSFFCTSAEHLKFEEKFDIIFSFSCFHWIKDKLIALKNISRHLKSKKDFYILTYLYSDSFVEPIRDVLNSKYYINLGINTKELEQFTSIGEYKTISMKSDLNLTEYSLIPKIVKFASLENYANHFKGFHPVSKMIPKQKVDSFFYKASHNLLKYSPFNQDGKIHCLLPTIILRFTKK